MRCAVLGAGSWGTALGALLAAKGWPVTVWDINTEVLDDIRTAGRNTRYLPGIDLPATLAAAVRDLAPGPGRRLGILVDHLVAGSKEWHEASAVARLGPLSAHVLVVGHPYIDIWQAVRPSRLGLTAWPVIPRGVSWKHGVLEALGWPHAEQRDVALGWKRILGTVSTYTDLEPELLGRVEQLIDFVTADAGDR